MRKNFLTPVFLLLLSANSASVFASEITIKSNAPPIKINLPELDYRMYTRSQAEMAAFYEGRQFSQKLINSLKDVCFFTIIVKNKSKDILWLEPETWPVSLASGKKLKLLGQQYWRKRWQAMGIAKSSQSTFRWTLLPESRDLRSDESVGGNYILPVTLEKIKVTPVFRVGAKGQSTMKLKTQTFQCGAR